jgi:hypothetical protein
MLWGMTDLRVFLHLLRIAGGSDQEAHLRHSHAVITHSGMDWAARHALAHGIDPDAPWSWRRLRFLKLDGPSHYSVGGERIYPGRD